MRRRGSFLSASMLMAVFIKRRRVWSKYGCSQKLDLRARNREEQCRCGAAREMSRDNDFFDRWRKTARAKPARSQRRGGRTIAADGPLMDRWHQRHRFFVWRGSHKTKFEQRVKC